MGEHIVWLDDKNFAPGFYFLDETSRYVGPHKTHDEADANYQSYIKHDINGITETFAMIKPDCASDPEKVGKIISIAIREGFMLMARKCTPGKQFFENIYVEHYGKPFFDEFISFMTSGPVVLMVLGHDDSSVPAFARWRNLMGATNPEKAVPGTIRHMFRTPGAPMHCNCVHGSSDAESARREVNIMFNYMSIL